MWEQGQYSSIGPDHGPEPDIASSMESIAIPSSSWFRSLALWVHALASPSLILQPTSSDFHGANLSLEGALDAETSDRIMYNVSV